VLACADTQTCVGRWFFALGWSQRKRQLPHFKANPWFWSQFNTNQFVITTPDCQFTFEQFTEVEVAILMPSRLPALQTNFRSVKDKFIQRSKWAYSRTTTPIHYYLCLVFEESADLNLSRSAIKAGLELLLNKWIQIEILSEIRYTKSYQLLKNLLGQIALITFKRCDYFIKQKLEHITDYIRNLPGANTQLKALQFDSAVVLKSIEVQHGLLVVERAREFTRPPIWHFMSISLENCWQFWPARTRDGFETVGKPD